MSNSDTPQNISSKCSIAVPTSQALLYDRTRLLLYFHQMEEDDFDADIPAYIKTARTAMKMTQEQLADVLGCTKSNISGWENGRHVPTYKQLCTIAKLSGHPLPHDRANEFIEILGTELKNLDVDQIEIIRTTARINKEKRPQLRKIVGTFNEPESSSECEDRQANGK